MIADRLEPNLRDENFVRYSLRKYSFRPEFSIKMWSEEEMSLRLLRKVTAEERHAKMVHDAFRLNPYPDFLQHFSTMHIPEFGVGRRLAQAHTMPNEWASYPLWLGWCLGQFEVIEYPAPVQVMWNDYLVHTYVTLPEFNTEH